ncbi:MAG TPA: hypothetical protein VFG14_00555 [Chthoniobacteraceae bacterium]|nr:hypothetical protein [Chthoniobacteraceae bacterium]
MRNILFLTFIVAHLATGSEQPLSEVNRAEAIAMAERYCSHAWTATEKNIYHGNDPNGIRVDSPNAGYKPQEGRGGWWEAGKKNVGIPYMWGGFDTPETFDAGLKEGKSAGDIYTLAKRKLLDDGVSTHAVGIDCSGFISRCWKLPRSFSTRELPGLCEPVPDLASLKPGDIFNTHNAHVVLFAGWTNPERTELLFYEAGSNPEWRVALQKAQLSFLLDKGYTAWRYRGMKD